MDMPDAEGDGLAAADDAADDPADDEAATEAAVLVALPWQAAVPARPATETTATARRTAERGQAEAITERSLADAHRVSCGPPGRSKP
jgi:hypothetical protein